MWTQMIGRWQEAETELALAKQDVERLTEKTNELKAAIIKQYGKRDDPEFIMWAATYFVVYSDRNGEVVIKHTEVKS